MRDRLLPLAACLAAYLVLSSLILSASSPQSPAWPSLKRFEPMSVPIDNPLTPEKVALGRKLFFDPRLSADESTSCSGCHEPKYGWTIGASKPIGAYGIEQNRACPSLINAGYSKGYYWENVPISLEKAVYGVWTFVLVPKGEGRPTPADIAARLNSDRELRRAFVNAFGAPADPDSIPKALASFIRTLVPSRSTWVRFHDGDKGALPVKARRGYAIFDGKARCSRCHSGVLLTDRLNHDVGTGGAFKTPTLLNIARSAPYFHDNRVPRLEEAVDRMLAGGFETKTPDPQLTSVKLTAEERDELIAFLRELNADPD